ncbi:MAG: hypothetical protein QOF58_362 [Pseudonocardiales bacterium]|nr:hypothetical protein [Pseudonocardiales bacterium]
MSARQESNRYLVLTVLCVPLVLTMLQSTVLSTALRAIQLDLHASITDVQWIVAGYSLTFAALMLTAGTFGDIHGRKKAFVLGLIVFLAGAVASALSTSVPWLIGSQLVMGFGAAWITPTSLAIIRDVFTDPKQRAGAIGIWAGIGGAAVSIGPAVGGPMVDAWGWQSIFWMYVPIAVLGLIACVVYLPESVTDGRRRLDLVGTVLSIAWIAAVVYGTIEGPRRGWTDQWVLGAYAVALVLFVGFIVVELRSKDPMLDLRTFRDSGFAGSVLAGFAVYFGLFAITYYMMIWLQNILGWSASGAGLAILPALLLSMVAAPVAGWMTSRFGGGIPLSLGLVAAALSLWGATFYGVGASLADYWWVVLLIGVGLGLTLTPISVVVMSRVPARSAGMASGAANAIRQLGGGIGIAVLGALLTDRMTTSTTDRLTAMGLPEEVRTKVVAGISSGASSASRQGGPVGDAVKLAFVDGLHLAEHVGAAILLGAAVITLILVGRKGSEDIASDRTTAAARR